MMTRFSTAGHKYAAGLLQRIATFILISAATVLSMSSAERALCAEKHCVPNIVLMLTDDQRWDAMGCAGNRVVHTPAMDQLAADGTLFANAFVTSSICAASRATIFTGLYERSHRCNFNTGGLRRSQLERSYPMLLRRAGYYTGFIGKYGVEYNPAAGKRDIEGPEVFDRWYGFYGQGVYFPKGSSGKHLNEVMVDQARDFLASVPAGKLFCLSISFKAPHSGQGYLGYDAEPDLRGLYARVTIPYPATARPELFAALPEFVRRSNARTSYWELRYSTPEKYQRTMRDYYALVSGADRAIGRIRAELARRGLSGNTVLVFMSDNGDMIGDFMLGGKELLYDASIRVPMIVFDPRAPKPARGQRRTELATNLDIAPMLLDLAGAPVPATMQGRSLVPLVHGQRVAWREDFYCENHFCVPEQYYPIIEGVRSAHWKYVRYPEMKPPYEQLFDLACDPDEINDLARTQAARSDLERLRRRCDELRAEAGRSAAPQEKAAK